jgi:CDGSH iron-sulfur domain-containing protein 3
MARLVRHEACQPHEIKPQEKSVWICMCGLSQNLPFCDGTHSTAKKTEQSGKCYVYDTDRRNVVEIRDDA